MALTYEQLQGRYTVRRQSSVSRDNLYSRDERGVGGSPPFEGRIAPRRRPTRGGLGKGAHWGDVTIAIFVFSRRFILFSGAGYQKMIFY